MMLRCPNCGGRSVFRHWFAMKEYCPTCGHSLANGNRVGAYIFNLGAAEIVLMAVLIWIVVARWPTPPWGLLQYLVPALALVMPLLFYPFSKLLFVAIDLAMYPDAKPDPVAHGKTT